MTNPLITVSDLSSYLRADLSGSLAGIAHIAINAASDVVRDYLGQSVDYLPFDTIRLNGTSTDALLLPQVPVHDVLLVRTATPSVPGGPLTWTEVDDWSVDEPGVGLLYRNPPNVWPQGRQNIEVTYTHGYVSATGSGSGSGFGLFEFDLPASITAVVLEVAARIVDQGLVADETIGTYVVSYTADTGVGLTDGEKAVLDQRKIDSR